MCSFFGATCGFQLLPNHDSDMWDFYMNIYVFVSYTVYMHCSVSVGVFFFVACSCRWVDVICIIMIVYLLDLQMHQSLGK